MSAMELLKELKTLGVSVSLDGDEMVLRPGARVPSEMITPLRLAKNEIMALLSQVPDFNATACNCNPLPSQAEYGHMAQAGCGPDYERCEACGYRWQCKVCSGCRQCRSSG